MSVFQAVDDCIRPTDADIKLEVSDHSGPLYLEYHIFSAYQTAVHGCAVHSSLQKHLVSGD